VITQVEIPVVVVAAAGAAALPAEKSVEVVEPAEAVVKIRLVNLNF
jgi:hypothetical protein